MLSSFVTLHKYKLKFYGSVSELTKSENWQWHLTKNEHNEIEQKNSKLENIQSLINPANYEKYEKLLFKYLQSIYGIKIYLNVKISCIILSDLTNIMNFKHL